MHSKYSLVNAISLTVTLTLCKVLAIIGDSFLC